MAINLEKGQREAIQVPTFTVGLGWDTNTSSSSDPYDLDASAFMLGENGKLLSDSHFVYYNNQISPDTSVTRGPDNIDGTGDGDDEVIDIDLSKIDPSIMQICLVVTIHEAELRRQNFGQVRNAYIRIVDGAGAEIVKYELDEDFSVETAVEFGRLYLRSGQWKFEAVGAGIKGGLQDYLDRYR
jgi:tellurium resistance protein TerD